MGWTAVGHRKQILRINLIGGGKVDLLEDEDR